MKLRQRAKAGLQKMEEMGQMGNSDEATQPDDIPFTVDDLDMKRRNGRRDGDVSRWCSQSTSRYECRCT